MYLISSEGYKNADVHILIIKKTGEIWLSMKDVGRGTRVKNIPDLVLKVPKPNATKTKEKKKIFEAKLSKTVNYD